MENKINMSTQLEEYLQNLRIGDKVWLYTSRYNSMSYCYQEAVVFKINNKQIIIKLSNQLIKIRRKNGEEIGGSRFHPFSIKLPSEVPIDKINCLNKIEIIRQQCNSIYELVKTKESLTLLSIIGNQLNNTIEFICADV